jgi:hypothetical protein
MTAAGKSAELALLRLDVPPEGGKPETPLANRFRKERVMF